MEQRKNVKTKSNFWNFVTIDFSRQRTNSVIFYFPSFLLTKDSSIELLMLDGRFLVFSDLEKWDRITSWVKSKSFSCFSDRLISNSREWNENFSRLKLINNSNLLIETLMTQKKCLILGKIHYWKQVLEISDHQNIDSRPQKMFLKLLTSSSVKMYNWFHNFLEHSDYKDSFAKINKEQFFYRIFV